MRRFLIASVLLAAIGVAAFWALTAPRVLTAADLPRQAGDLGNGRIVFYAGGCASCHAAPGAKGDDKLSLAGGLELKTPFGTFVAPNISPDREDGIGSWSALDLANALTRGVAPDGRHYYPAFPYLSYQRMTLTDVIDLKAFLDTLPAVQGRAPDHDLPLPLRFRRGIGLWKWLYMDYRTFSPDPQASEQVNRGAYLVTGPGHCGECHTPRDALGGPDLSRWLGGAPNPEGRGRIPNITPSGKNVSGWSAADIAEYLKSGFTPDYDTAGGAMVDVVANTSLLPPEDRAAIAAYLKAVPAVEN